MAAYNYQNRWPAVAERRERLRQLLASPVKYRQAELANMLGVSIGVIKQDLRYIRRQEVTE